MWNSSHSHGNTSVKTLTLAGMAVLPLVVSLGQQTVAMYLSENADEVTLTEWQSPRVTESEQTNDL